MQQEKKVRAPRVQRRHKKKGFELTYWLKFDRFGKEEGKEIAIKGKYPSYAAADQAVQVVKGGGGMWGKYATLAGYKIRRIK